MKMLQLKLDDAKAIFRRVGKSVQDVSPCCNAALLKGVCLSCGKAIPMPFYFVTKATVPDQFYIDTEARFRAKLPVGSEMVMCVPHH